MLSNTNIILSLIITTIPAMGYLAAYFYQLGVYSFFNVPQIFVQIGLETVVFATAITTLFIGLIFSIIYMAFISPRKNDTSKIHKPQEKDLVENIIVLLIILPVIGFFIVSAKLQLAYKILFFIGIITIPIIALIPPLFKFPNEKTYARKYLKYSEYLYQEKNKKTESSDNASKLLTFFRNLPYINYMSLLAFILVWTFCAFLLGRINYSDATEHVIYNYDGGKYIVAGVYSDQLLMVKIDENQKITLKETLLIPLNNDIKFTLEDLGKLNQIQSINR